MALSLRFAITATQTTVDILGTDDLADGDVLACGSEYVQVRGEPFVPALAHDDPYHRFATVYRGVQGTTEAEHEADAALTLTLPGGGGGGGLPPQWTDGGNGNVTATVDDTTKTPITIDLPVDQTGRALVIRDSDGNTLFEVSSTGVLSISDSAGDNSLSLNPQAGTFVAGGLVSGAGVRFNTTSGISSVPSDSASDTLELSGLHLVAADGAAMIRIVNPIGDMPDNFYGGTVDLLGDPAGDLTINADMSDGAAKLLLKGATPDGTIVAARIPMIPGGYDVPQVAAHVADGSTVDQLRDALIAAGLMAAS